MNYKSWLIGAAGAAALGLIGSSAQAAPLGALSDTRSAAGQTSNVESVAWVRHCYWHRGHRHCRRVWREYGYYSPYYDYGYYGGPYAYGPAFGFYFGGGRGGHHHHGGGHHHRR